MVEMMVSLVVFGVVMALGLSFLAVQTRGFRLGLDEMSVMQTLRYALGTLEQDIQTAGTNVTSGQPEMVYAGSDVIAFNADYVTPLRNDPFAVFYDPDVEPEAGSSLPVSRQIAIPGTSFVYPDTTYMEGATRGPAETLILFFEADTATGRDDDFALYRQVNDGDPQLVATNLLAPTTGNFFEYYTVGDTAAESVAGSSLPLRHSATIHGSAADTGAVARIDSIRAVRFNLRATNGKEGAEERTAELTRMVLLPNVGFGTLETCGSPPILGTGISATVVMVDGAPAVDLAWAPSTDEGGGEGDVVRYVLYRREAGTGAFDEPYLSIPAGETSYTYQDADVEPGVTYDYAVAAQDCTPTLSSLSPAASAVIPST